MRLSRFGTFNTGDHHNERKRPGHNGYLLSMHAAYQRLDRLSPSWFIRCAVWRPKWMGFWRRQKLLEINRQVLPGQWTFSLSGAEQMRNVDVSQPLCGMSQEFITSKGYRGVSLKRIRSWRSRLRSLVRTQRPRSDETLVVGLGEEYVPRTLNQSIVRGSQHPLQLHCYEPKCYKTMRNTSI